MKKKAILIVAGIAVLTVAVSAHAGLVEQSAILDRSYVPALALTNQREKPQAMVEESMRRLVAAWDSFVARVTPSDGGKASLNEAIKRSTASVEEARGLVAADKRKEAHEALETIRMLFWKARVDMGVDYLPDRFTAFHEPMEEFADLASKPGTDPALLRQRLNELSARWKDVEDAGLDVKLFGVSPERAAKYAEQVKKEREILTQLEGLTASASREALGKAATAMKGNFAQAFFVFGDFSGLQ